MCCWDRCCGDGKKGDLKVLLVILFLCVCFLMGGCSRFYLPDTATPEQKREATCQDAKDWVKMADDALSLPVVSPELRLYWTVARVGAQAGVKSLCREVGR